MSSDTRQLVLDLFAGRESHQVLAELSDDDPESRSYREAYDCEWVVSPLLN